MLCFETPHSKKSRLKRDRFFLDYRKICNLILIRNKTWCENLLTIFYLLFCMSLWIRRFVVVFTTVSMLLSKYLVYYITHCMLSSVPFCFLSSYRLCHYLKNKLKYVNRTRKTKSIFIVHVLILNYKVGVPTQTRKCNNFYFHINIGVAFSWYFDSITNTIYLLIDMIYFV